MAKLLLISNRGPVVYRTGEGGALVARRGGGGLVTALDGLAAEHEVTWVAHAMGDADLKAAAQSGNGGIVETSRRGGTYRLRFSGAPDAHYEGYYNVISNPLLWFVQHGLYGFGTHPTIDRATQRAWRSYELVNRRMARTAAEEAERIGGDASVMVHDYQLMLVPRELREQHPGLPIEFFLHIPWPQPGMWRCLPDPWVRQLVASVLHSDIAGFQTRRDVDAFVETAIEYLGPAAQSSGWVAAEGVGAVEPQPVVAERDEDGWVIRYGEQRTLVRCYPITVAVNEFQHHRESATVHRLRRRIEDMRPGRNGKLIVRVDRTDPSKNIVRGFRAFRLLLHEHPELHEQVSMFCQLDPSRQDVDEYARYMRDIQAAADEVNIEFATATWQPLYLNLDSNFAAAVAAYMSYDVLFVNSVADGMNLVSKEGPIVNERDGVVVLSRSAGSFSELGEWVVPVSAFDICEQADALHWALTLDTDQRAQMSEGLTEVVQSHDVDDWIGKQLADLGGIPRGAIR